MASRPARLVAISSLSQIAGRILSAAVGMVTLIITTRYLGLTDYGQLATVVIYLSIFLILTDAGFISVTIREMARKPEKAASVLGNILIMRSVAGLILTGAAVGIGVLIYSGGSAADIRLGIEILAASLFLNAVDTTLSSVVAARIHNQLLAIGDLLNKVVVLSAVIWVVAVHGSFEWIVFAYLLGYVAQLISDAFFSLRRVRPSLTVDPGYIRAIVISTLPYSAAVIINTLYFRADGFMLSLMRGSAAVGLYSVAYKVVEITMAFALFVGVATLPLMSEAKDKTRVRSVVWRANQGLAILGAVVAVGTIAVAPQIAVILGGQSFEAAWVPLAILMLGNYLIYQSTSYMQALLASDNQSSILKVNTALLVVNVALNLILIPLFNVAGAAWAVVASELISLILVRRYFGRNVAAPLPWFDLLKPLVPGACMMGVMLGMKALLINFGYGPIVIVIGCGIVGAAVFAVVTQYSGLFDVKGTLRSMLARQSA